MKWRPLVLNDEMQSSIKKETEEQWNMERKDCKSKMFRTEEAIPLDNRTDTDPIRKKSTRKKTFIHSCLLLEL